MLRLIAAFVLLPTLATAQAGPPEVQALQNKLMQEISSGLQCSIQTLNLQRELEAAKRELKELKDKEAK